MLKQIATAAFGAVLALGAATCATRAGEEESLPYTQVAGVAGTINSIGSDTMNNLMTLWGEAFRAMYPNVNIQVEGKGSGTAPPALAAGTAQLGPMSREMTEKEIEAFEKERGFKPTEIAVAVDCLAVFVNKDNPIRGMTLAQIDAVFSSTLRRNPDRREGMKTWGELGLTDEWAQRAFSLYGRNSVSGTNVYFKENALAKGDFLPTVKEQPGSAAVIHGIAGDKAGIGYSGIGYTSPDVRIVPLAEKDGDAFVEANFENAVNGAYPLSRLLYIYVAKNPAQPLDPATKEFLKFVLSKEGQEIVRKDGFGALPIALAAEMPALWGD